MSRVRLSPEEINAKVNTTTSVLVIKSNKQTRQWGVLYEMIPKTEEIAAFASTLKTATVEIGTVRTLSTITSSFEHR